VVVADGGGLLCLSGVYVFCDDLQGSIWSFCTCRLFGEGIMAVSDLGILAARDTRYKCLKDFWVKFLGE